MAAMSASHAIVMSWPWPATPVVATAKVTWALLVSKRPGNHLTLVNQKKKKKKNLAFAHKDAMVCVPVGAVVFKVSQGPGGGEERRGEGRGKVREEG